MKGIILAGGTGSRLRPMTYVTNKHLLPVFDRPMIYFPILTLVKGGVTDIAIVTGNESAGDFIDLLGNGENFGADFTYKVQTKAGGIAEALNLTKRFCGDENMVVILGDNLFLGDETTALIEHYNSYDEYTGGVVLKEVQDPKRFGVASVDEDLGKILKIVEKPQIPDSNLAVTGMYFYDEYVWEAMRSIKPSGRGELEITDVNNWYINNRKLKYTVFEDFWSDAGTVESLHASAKEVEKRMHKGLTV